MFDQYVCPDCLDAVLDLGASGSLDDEVQAVLSTVAPKQREGVVRLYNLLTEHGVALLADEVGMGKTYQGLGVVSLLFALKPNARVLVIAPNENVQRGWQRAYADLIETKTVGSALSDPLLGAPKHPLYFCGNVIDLARDYLDNPAGLFLARITSFSSLRGSIGLSIDEPVSPKDIQVRWHSKGLHIHDDVVRDAPADTFSHTVDVNVECARQLASLFDTFDLVVVDESHNIRKRGANIKTKTLELLLQFPKPRLLLMTATPAYHTERDIYHQFAYRDETGLTLLKDGHVAEAQQWIQERTIRRLRQLSDKTKYDYRRERAIPTLPTGDDDDDVQELMLALIQKRLAQNMSHKDAVNPSVRMGFLETFESYENPDEAHASIPENVAHYDEIKAEEIPSDREVLLRLIRDLNVDFADGGKVEMPPHPKLSKIASEFRRLQRQPRPEKVLIFVRRTASVREISRRLCHEYDKVALEQIHDAYGQRFETTKQFQSFVHRSLAQDPSVVATLIAASNQKDDQEVAYSKVLSPFRSGTQLDGDKFYAGGFGFRQKFNRGNTLENFFSENRLRLLHAMVGDGDFFVWIKSLVPDEMYGALSQMSDQPIDNITARDFCDAVVLDHVSKNASGDVAGIAVQLLAQVHSAYEGSKSGLAFVADKDLSKIKQSTHNFITKRHFWDFARDASGDIEGQLRVALGVPSVEALDKRTAWQQMASKFIRMSDTVIDVFFAFLKAKNQNKVNRAMMARVLAGNLFQSPKVRFARARHRLTKSWELFNHITKHLGLKRSQWLTHDWSEFDRMEPAVGAMGSSGSRKVAIAQFNAPFFPDAIAATSVFREGVDLHLSCRRVWHYGLPASPGALEQQTGRVDRYFAHVHRALELERNHVDDWTAFMPRDSDADHSLDVGYPFVPKSIDESQLKRALQRKAIVQPIMDQGLDVAQTSDEVALGWTQTLTPDEIIAQMQDAQPSTSPFPGKPFHHESCVLQAVDSREQYRAGYERLVKRLQELSDEGFEYVPLTLRFEDLRYDAPLALLNKYIEFEGTLRHQPTLVYLRYMPLIHMHALEFDTPLAKSVDQLEALQDMLCTRFPTQACRLERKVGKHEHWHTHLVTGKVLPHFVAGDVPDLHHRLHDFMEVADVLERELLAGDIKRDEVQSTLGRSK